MRWTVASLVVVGSLSVCVIIAQVHVLARLLTDVAQSRFDRVPQLVVVLVGVFGARSLLVLIRESVGLRSATKIKAELRGALVGALVSESTRRLPSDSSARTGLAVTATSGLDELDNYVGRYLPALVLAALAPVSLLVVVAYRDFTSLILLALTLPFLPLILAIVGLAASDRAAIQAQTLDRVAAQLYDGIRGLLSLRNAGRAEAYAERVALQGQIYRDNTMKTLRWAFISSGAMELQATIGTALVAVSVGLRLRNGDLELYESFVVLMLAPEVFLPIRTLGQRFHASVDVMAQLDAVFDVVQPESQVQLTAVAGKSDETPEHRDASIVFSDVDVRYADTEDAIVAGFDLTVQPGSWVGLVGPSGCGKSTLLTALLGFVEPTSGSIHVCGRHLDAQSIVSVRQQIAWVPQTTHLLATTIADNVRLGQPEATDTRVWEALDAACVGDVVRRLPDGLETPIGGRAPLSMGEQQRIAIARALLRDAPIILLDEPSSHLDDITAQKLAQSLRTRLAGKTVVIAGHREPLIDVADHVVQVGVR